MAFSVRRLVPGNEAVLARIAADEADFDLAGRSTPSAPLKAEAAAAYLDDPAVLHWIAEEDGRVIGFSICYVLRRRSDAERELLLFEIGVRERERRRGVGTALVRTMRDWMEEEAVMEAWVLADNTRARAFYAACGFERDEEQGVQMLLTLAAADDIRSR